MDRRVFIESQSDLARTSRHRLPDRAVHRVPTGELAATVFPRDVFERVMYPGTALKTVLWGPFVARPKPAWFVTRRRAHVGRRLAPIDASPSIWRLRRIVVPAIRAGMCAGLRSKN